MYNESDNHILMNNSNPMEQQQANSIKIQQQQQAQKVAYTGPGQLASQHKSLSFGNLTNQQTNGQTNSTHNLNHITSPSQRTKQPKQPNMNISSHNHHHHQQHYGNGNHETNGNETNHSQSHSMSMSMKNLKINQSNQFISHHGPNGDHSGGDNDSGISSMSSETAAALNNANTVPNSFGYLQKQQHQPILMGQRFNNNGHITQQAWQQQQQQQPFIQNQSQRQPVYHGNHHGSNLNINQSPVNTSVANTSVSKAVLETLV